jgi:hypothetical protein
MQSPQKPWKRNTSQFLTVNSIFAALSGILIVLVLQEDKYFNKLIPLVHIPFAFLAAGIFFISFFLFALAAEKTTDALDEDDSKKYVYYMLHYNAGVVLLLVGIALLIFFRYYPLVSSLMPASVTVPVPRIPYFIPSSTRASISIWVIHLIISVIYLTAIVRFFLYRFWIDDIRFILFRKDELKDYFDELKGMIKECQDRGVYRLGQNRRDFIISPEGHPRIIDFGNIIFSEDSIAVAGLLFLAKTYSLLRIADLQKNAGNDGQMA